MNLLTRVAAAGRLLVRGDYGPSADSVGPFDPKVEGLWSIIRGGEPQQYTKQGRNVREFGYESNATVQRCVSIIADQVATVGLQAYRKTKQGDTELVPTSPLQQLLDQPSRQMPGFTYRRLIAVHLALYGNAYVAIIREKNSINGQPIALRTVHPERLQQVTVDTALGEILEYVWTNGAGVQQRAPWFNMIHARDLIVEPDQWFGFPRGAAALAAMATDTEATTYVRQVLGNSGIPGMVVLAEAGFGKDELAKAETDWQEKMAKRGGRGRTRFLSGIKDVKVIGHSLKDLEFPLLRGISREDICTAFGVDPRLAGVTAGPKDAGMSGQQYTEARRKLEQLTCAPLRAAITEAHDSTLTVNYGYTYCRFDPDAIGALLETPAEVAERATKMLAAGATLEESRRAIGLPEQMDPAHHTTFPSLRTVAKAIELSELPPPALLGDGGLPGEEKPTASPAEDKQQRALIDAPQRYEASQSPPVKRALRGNRSLTASQRETLWRAADARATAHEPAFRDRAAAIFVMEAADVQRIIDRVAESDDGTRAMQTRDDGAFPAFWQRLTDAIEKYYGGVAPEQWARGMGPDVAQLFLEAAGTFSSEMGVSFDLANPEVIAAVQRRVNKLAGHVSDTTRRQLQVVIAAGRQAGQSPDQISKAIRAAVFDPAITVPRAGVIARTETMGAINEGEYVAADESGVMQSIGWLDQPDNKVRDSHVACAKQGWVKLGERFSNGLRYPHDPEGEASEVVECRCTALYSDLEPADAQLEQPHGEPAK